MVLEEDGGPAIGWGKEKVLCLLNCALELGKCPIVRGGLEFVGALTDVDNIL